MQEVYGSVAEFLENDNGHIFLGNIVNDLNRVRERLSEGEKQIMSLLAKTDTALTTNEILANLQLTKSSLLEICQSLDRRFLIEKKKGSKNMFALKPIFKTYWHRQTNQYVE